MDAENFAEWFRRQGHKVVQTPSSYWFEAGPRVFQAFPYHWVISPGEEELGEFMHEQKALALRYSTPQTAPVGSLSYHVMLENTQYLLEDLPKKARHDVKKGLSLASIERIPLSRLAAEGWGLRRDTLIRQGRQNAETEMDWRKLCLSAENLDGFEAWGAVIQGKLAASLLALLCDDHFCILYQQSQTEHLSCGVNNALAFFVTSDATKRLEGAMKVFYGLHSLDAPPSVDEFKFRMGYTPKPVRQRVVFHPWVRPFMNDASHALVRAGLHVNPENPTLSKAEGMLRFYLQGKLPLAQQSLPPPLQTLEPSQTLQNQ